MSPPGSVGAGPHAIRLPSADQGWLLSQMSPVAVATTCSSVPSAFITLATQPVLAAEYSMNASFEPSGDQRGRRALSDFSVTGSLPSAATV